MSPFANTQLKPDNTKDKRSFKSTCETIAFKAFYVDVKGQRHDFSMRHHVDTASGIDQNLTPVQLKFKNAKNKHLRNKLIADDLK